MRCVQTDDDDPRYWAWLGALDLMECVFRALDAEARGDEGRALLECGERLITRIELLLDQPGPRRRARALAEVADFAHRLPTAPMNPRMRQQALRLLTYVAVRVGEQPDETPLEGVLH